AKFGIGGFCSARAVHSAATAHANTAATHVLIPEHERLLAANLLIEPLPVAWAERTIAEGGPACSREAVSGAAIIVDVVTGYVGGVAVGVERRAGALRHGKIDPAADRGSVPEGTRRLHDLGGKILGGTLVVNDGPVDDDLLLPYARP